LTDFNKSSPGALSVYQAVMLDQIDAN